MKPGSEIQDNKSKQDAELIILDTVNATYRVFVWNGEWFTEHLIAFNLNLSRVDKDRNKECALGTGNVTIWIPVLVLL